MSIHCKWNKISCYYCYKYNISVFEHQGILGETCFCTICANLYPFLEVYLDSKKRNTAGVQNEKHKGTIWNDHSYFRT